jgi:hypothetical protein
MIKRMIACVFSTQLTFQGNEVRKSPHGKYKTVVPRKKALAGYEKEFVDCLSRCWHIERLQPDPRTLALLGVSNDGNFDTHRPDSGHQDTLIPNDTCNYTYSICFDSLLEISLAESEFKLNDKGIRNLDDPSPKALKKLNQDLNDCLGYNYSIDRLEVIPGGGIYFMMLDTGMI